MKVLAVDPGVKGIGLSIWIDQTLVCAAYQEVNTLHALSLGLRILGPDLIVCEIPQVYVQRLQRGDPNDLVSLALVAGTVLSCAPEAKAVKPATWKGQVPKDIHNRRTLAALTPDERALVEAVKPAWKRHNAIDAVGLGLWHFGRRGVDLRGQAG